MAIKNNYLVEKSNVLNEMRCNNMTLQELRFFSIYLSKINSRIESTRVVKFTVNDFQKIMNFGRMNIKQLENTATNLLSKVVKVPIEKGGFVAFQIFKECKVYIDNEIWYIEIDAHDKALPLMFELKDKYFTYKLWNALLLKSLNQLRLYELLKQYERIGKRIISVDELKELIGLKKDEYPRWERFKTKVLNVCQKALSENTDICFTYEPYGKKGKSGKILNLIFNITRNENYCNPLTLEEFIGKQNPIEEVVIYENPYQQKFNFLKEACNNEFSEEEFKIIYNLVMQVIPTDTNTQYGLDNEQYNYIMRKYGELNLQASRRTIKSRFGYLKKLFEIDME